MFAFARVAPAVGCALMMAICLAVIGFARAMKWARHRFSSAGRQRADDVEALRVEVACLQTAVDARDRSGSPS